MINLYPHQESALELMEGRNRVAFFHDMGLGKTYTGAEKAIRMGATITLVVCQKSKVQDWVNHFKEHYSLPVYDLTSKKDFERFFEMWDLIDGFVGIVNYDLAWRRKELLQLKDFTLILDESSLIQNRKTNRTKFILRLKPQNIILLSGTPTAGKYENLWSQMHLLGWDISESTYNFQYVNWKKIYVKGGILRNVVNKDDPYKNVERLKQKMREHGCHFLKTEDVLDLPKQTFIQMNVPVSREYKRFLKDRIVKVDDLEFVGDSILSFRLYQRMLCTAFNENKVQAFKDLLESTQDRLVVFYNFKHELDVLQKACVDLDRPYSVVNGTIKDLTAYEQESNSVTFVQYKAGAMGLNLQKANKIIYFSLTEEAELFEQSKKRIHRIGQEQPCFYYLLICPNSIEDQEILPMLNIRKEYSDVLFEETI